MPPRPMLPPDDLYARLELPVDCSYEAIEVAWRALLKRHHPDIAGPGANAVAKQINVAHDWLSDPDLRARYDRERHPRAVRGVRSGRPIRESAGRDPAREASARTMRRRPDDPEEALVRHFDRIRRLSEDELDRLTLAETQPIAFVASIARFLPKERLRSLGTVDRRVRDALPRSARWDAPTRDAAIGFAYELLLGPFLDEHLSEPFRERVRERLARGWEAAVDQPRYGPNSTAVAAALRRLATAGAADLDA
ncbi:MAG: DnaJ domain-containing protein, partial [Chloroflexi bacterium]|nr:DnaJ domain-containing protein [Chloroflexota bacterium]